jgi:hypothetical protein
MDNSLIKELSPEKLYLNTDVVIRLFLSLGFLISWKKPDLIPFQDYRNWKVPILRSWAPMLV